MIALSIVVALFAIYEVIERVWLSDLDMETIHVLHRIRGLTFALLASTIVGWTILRWPHLLLDEALSSDDWTSGVRPSKEDRNTVYSRWFILARAGKLAAVGEMAGEVAHEVNNPIAIISSKARLLLANHRVEISDKIAGELTKITEMADRVARIVQGLLSYSRPSAGLRETMDGSETTVEKYV